MSITTRTYQRTAYAIIPGNGVTFQFGKRGIRVRKAVEDNRPTAWIAKDPWQPISGPSLPVLIYRAYTICCL